MSLAPSFYVMEPVAAVFAALTVAVGAHGGWSNATLLEATKLYAPQTVILYCGSPGYGAADIETGEIWLNSTFCGPLSLLYGGGTGYPRRQGVGLLTLAHEALHIRGIWNEAKAECWAYQQVDNLARLWHVPPEWQAVILPYAYRDSLALQKGSQVYGDFKRCRPDGVWDMTPYDGRWP